jgi:hypothetical protein
MHPKRHHPGRRASPAMLNDGGGRSGTLAVAPRGVHEETAPSGVCGPCRRRAGDVDGLARRVRAGAEPARLDSSLWRRRADPMPGCRVRIGVGSVRLVPAAVPRSAMPCSCQPLPARCGDAAPTCAGRTGTPFLLCRASAELDAGMPNALCQPVRAAPCQPVPAAPCQPVPGACVRCAYAGAAPACAGEAVSTGGAAGGGRRSGAGAGLLRRTPEPSRRTGQLTAAPWTVIPR